MKGYINNKMGTVTISPDVIANFAGSQAVACFGIVGMAAINMTDGIVRLLKRSNLSRGIVVTIDANKITIDFHVIVSYGVNICVVANNLTESVKYKVEEFAGLEVVKINIYVEGVRVID